MDRVADMARQGAPMEVVIAFILGAATVVATKRGKGVVRRAVVWTARRAGSMSMRASEALKDAQRVAREEFLRGREARVVAFDQEAPRTEDQSSAEPALPTANGGEAVTKGHINRAEVSSWRWNSRGALLAGWGAVWRRETTAGRRVKRSC